LHSEEMGGALGSWAERIGKHQGGKPVGKTSGEISHDKKKEKK